MVLQSIFMIIKITVVMVMFFYLLPFWGLKKAGLIPYRERIWFVGVLVTGWVTLSVYLLVFLKIYSFISLAIFVGIGYLTFLKINGFQNPLGFIRKWAITVAGYIFDYMDHELDFRLFLKQKRFHIKIFLGRFLKKALSPTGLILIVILGISAFIRFRVPVQTYAPSLSDSYIAIAWMKYIGQNRIFVDGIYPQGFYILLSVLMKLTGLDAVNIVRFTGPLVNMMLVFSVYWFTRKWTGKVWGGLLACFIYGVITNWQFPRDIMRQMASLSQEYGFFFILPTLYFLLGYLKTRRFWNLLGYAFSLVLVLFIHPVSALGVLLGVGAILGTGFIYRLWNKNKLKKFFIYSSVAAIIGILPLVTGKIWGLQFHAASAQYTFANSTPAQFTPFLVAIVISGLLLLGTNLLVRNRNIRINNTFILLLFGLCLLAYFSKEMGFKYMFDPARVRELVALSGVVLAGAALNNFLTVIKKINTSKQLPLVLSVSLIIYLFYLFPPQFNEPYKMEYDIFVQSYLNIAERYPPLEWTIISQVEEYPLVLNRGWHMNVNQFVHTFKPDNMNYPTPYLFLFVEKKIFKISVNRTQADYELRAKEEDSLYAWAEKYRQNHSNMKIYYDDSNVRIYFIDAQKEFASAQNAKIKK